MEAGGEYVWTAVGAMVGPSAISASWTEIELSGSDTPSKEDPVGLFHYIGAGASVAIGAGWSHIYSGNLEGKGWALLWGWDIGADSIIGRTWDNGGAYEKCCPS